MKKVDANGVIICLACLIMLFIGGSSSLAIAEEGPHFTVEQAITAARRNAKPGSSFAIFRKILADADTQRVGDQALAQAHAHTIELFDNGMLMDILKSGAYLIAEIDPLKNNMVAMHFVFKETGGAVKDVPSNCHGAVKPADAGELVKDTAELVKQLYSTPSTEGASLASRFYGGNFPDGNDQPDSLFAIPNFLRKSSATPNEVREAAALYWGYAFWAARYALSLPAYAASPAAAENAAEKKRDALMAEFLQLNNIDRNINLVDFDDVRNERQYQERIELLSRLDGFLEDSFRKGADPVVFGANLSILTIPLSVDEDLNQAGLYVSSSPPNSLFLWHRVASGGFAVKEITWDW